MNSRFFNWPVTKSRENLADTISVSDDIYYKIANYANKIKPLFLQMVFSQPEREDTK